MNLTLGINFPTSFDSYQAGITIHFQALTELTEHFLGNESSIINRLNSSVCNHGQRMGIVSNGQYHSTKISGALLYVLYKVFMEHCLLEVLKLLDVPVA